MDRPRLSAQKFKFFNGTVATALASGHFLFTSESVGEGDLTLVLDSNLLVVSLNALLDKICDRNVRSHSM